MEESDSLLFKMDLLRLTTDSRLSASLPAVPLNMAASEKGTRYASLINPAILSPYTAAFALSFSSTSATIYFSDWLDSSSLLDDSSHHRMLDSSNTVINMLPTVSHNSFFANDISRIDLPFV